MQDQRARGAIDQGFENGGANIDKWFLILGLNAVILGLAIVSMHHVGMAALILTPIADAGPVERSGHPAAPLTAPGSSGPRGQRHGGHRT